VAIELVFETHTTTVDNEQGRATGWLPGQLAERGRAEARQLGLRRVSDGIAAVFSSDLARAAQTASIAFGGSAIPVLHDWRLRECDYGRRNGMPVAELHAGRRDHLDRPYPDGEAGGRLLTGSAAFSVTCPCAGMGGGSSSSVTSPPGGAWITSSAVSRWNILPSRTSPGRRDGSTGSASPPT
jgi:2,3-bisphosphoglycerate-dependent phosphoglycerate mutase